MITWNLYAADRDKTYRGQIMISTMWKIKLG